MTSHAPDNQSTGRHDAFQQNLTRPTDPGRSLGIAGLVLSLLGPLTVIGLILSIIALVQSRRAGTKNGFALAGVIIGTVFTVAGIALIIFGLTTVLDVCAELGNGVHERNGITYTCNT